MGFIQDPLYTPDYQVAGDEVAVFGDAENDLAILSKVRHSVAVANATDEVLRCANYRVGASAEMSSYVSSGTLESSSSRVPSMSKTRALCWVREFAEELVGILLSLAFARNRVWISLLAMRLFSCGEYPGSAL